MGSCTRVRTSRYGAGPGWSFKGKLVLSPRAGLFNRPIIVIPFSGIPLEKGEDRAPKRGP